MQRKSAWKRGRAVSILLAGGIGYLLGGWHAGTFHGADLSPAQTVALRFPEDRDDTGALGALIGPSKNAPDAAGAATAMVLGDRQLALLSPAPMVPQAAAQSTPQATLPPAAIEAAVPAPVREAAPPQHPAATVVHPAALQPMSQAKPAAVLDHRHADRPRYVLNDAQIASIKERLHLTPDQEAMWPAVEAALRNVAYAQAREAHRHGARASAAQLASADPDSVEVQGLKSAAIPLLMSFSPEQKNEVRSMAHVMGLDNLASQL